MPRTHSRVFAAACVAFGLSGCYESFVVTPDDCECAAGEVCAPEGCVADCSAAMAPDIAELDPSLSVIQTLCVTLEPGPLGAFGRADGSIELTHVHGVTLERATDLTIDRFVANAATGSVARAGVACSAVFEADRDGVVPSFVENVAISDDGAFAAFALDAFDTTDGSRRRVEGAWYVSGRGCSFEQNGFIAARGIAFGRATGGVPDVFVSGIEGVFLDGRRVVARSTPGSLWRTGDGMLVGSVLGHSTRVVTYFPLASVDPGSLLRMGDAGVVEAEGEFYQFAWIEGRGAVSAHESRSAGVAIYDGLQVEPLELREDVLDVGDPVQLTGSGFSAAIPITGSGRFLLRHEAGLLLVE